MYCSRIVRNIAGLILKTRLASEEGQEVVARERAVQIPRTVNRDDVNAKI